MKIMQSDGQAHVSFMFGKAKLAPTHATTIPRLELCAAVLAVEITQVVVNGRAIEPDSITYYSDSRVVLGYIANETRRFYVYVSNRVERIRRYSSPDQWQYVSTHQNPADVATRPVKVCNLESLTWLSGPRFWSEPEQQCIACPTDIIEESFKPGQLSQALTISDPILMSTPKKVPVNKKNEESKVTISVKYPSKLKNKKIVGDFAKIVKAILHQNPKGIATVVVKSKSLREKVIDCLLQLIKTEIDGLCSVKNPINITQNN